jgi:hypothetical protein
MPNEIAERTQIYVRKSTKVQKAQLIASLKRDGSSGPVFLSIRASSSYKGVIKPKKFAQKLPLGVPKCMPALKGNFT